MSNAYVAIADRLNEWSGFDHPFSPAEVEFLVRDLAMDSKLEDELRRAVVSMRRNLAAERQAILN